MNMKSLALRSAAAVPAVAFASIFLTACESSRNTNIPDYAWVEDSNAKAGQETVYLDPIPSAADDKVILPGGDILTAQHQGSTDAGETKSGTAANPAETVVIPDESVPAVDGGVLYKVQKNDSLWNISMIYGVSVDRLAEINGLDKAAILPVGKVLTIPPEAKNAVNKPIPAAKKSEPVKKSESAKTTAKPASSTKSAAAQPTLKEGEKLYVVKSGDTLSEIAYANRVKTANLAKANNIAVNSMLHVNQTLVIPAPDSSVKAPTVKPKNTASTATPKTSTSSTAKTETKAPVSTPKADDKSTVSAPKTGTSSTIPAPKNDAKTTNQPSSNTPGGNTVTIPDETQAENTAAVNNMSLSICIENPMKLEEVAKVHDRDVKQVYELNPNITPGTMIPAGTLVKIPLF